MIKIVGLGALMGVFCLHLYGYVPYQPLLGDVVGMAQEQFNTTLQELQQKKPDFTPAHAEELDGFICINGFNAFDQKVVQASYAKPVVVLFFAQRDLASKTLWYQLQPVMKNLQAQAAEVKKMPDFVAIDIFQKSDGDTDNQNYQIALRCMDAVGKQSFQLPVVVFFKEGQMCSSDQAILVGDVSPALVRAITNKLLLGAL